MAEAAVETISLSRYYCHKCTREIYPVLPDFICPVCSLGFIEELSNRGSQYSNRSTHSEETALRQGNDGSEDAGQVPGSQRSRRHSVLIHNWPASLDTTLLEQLQPLLQQFTQQLASGRGGTQRVDVFPVIVRRILGNYVLEGTLDNVTMQLINQVDVAGPLPMTQQKIEQIPRLQITKEQVDRGVMCPICIEEFHYEEEVRQLQCEHQYHGHCIVPWLEMHATCPVCRLTLDAEEDADIQDGTTNESSGLQSQERCVIM